MTTLTEFDRLGRSASFHYADDTASGEWRLGDIDKLAALALFDAHPELQGEMREIAGHFLWSLSLERK